MLRSYSCLLPQCTALVRCTALVHCEKWHKVNYVVGNRGEKELIVAVHLCPVSLLCMWLVCSFHVVVRLCVSEVCQLCRDSGC